MLDIFKAVGTMPVERDRLNRVDRQEEIVEAQPRSILLDIPSGPEAVFIFKDFRSWYTSALEQDSVGIAVGEGVVDGRFEPVEKLDVKKEFSMFALVDGDSTV